MRFVLADIANGETGVADVMFLVAFILFVIATVWAIVDRAFQSALISGGLACVALGWLVL